MHSRRKYFNLGGLLTLIIAITPIVLWLIAMPMTWDSTKNIFENLGKLAGLAGMALFAWAVILSARFKIYNRMFHGLDNTYRAHHNIGLAAFMLLLIHPILITYRYFLSSPASAYEFLKPSPSSPFRALGSIALFLMILGIGVTLYINVKYEKFILVQRALGLVLFIGAVHAVFVGNSDLGVYGMGILSLQAYFALLIGIAAIIYVYRSIFHGNFSKFYNYKIESIKQMGDVYELELSTDEQPMPYKPGQFAFIKLDTNGLLSQSHPFSMSSKPGSNKLSFGIKNLGDYTLALGDAQKGSLVKVDGPYGTFSNIIVNNPRQIWVAGGIGITPFLAMAKSIGDSQKIDLYYSAKSLKEAVYLDELRSIASKNSNFKVIPFLEDRDGFITADIIFKNSPDLQDANFMICGPATMMMALRMQIKSKGIANKNINTEEFNFS